MIETALYWVKEIEEQKSELRECTGTISDTGIGGEGTEDLLNGYRVSVLQQENSYGNWFHNNVNVLNAAELYT